MLYEDYRRSNNESYTYDANGNILTSTVSADIDTFVYDDSNRLIEYNGQAVTYDLDGNMLSANGISLTYDSANRLLSANGNSYTYDVENTRVKNLCNGVETQYTYNTNTELSQLLVKTTGATITKYVYGNGLIGEETAGVFKTYHFDYRGSTVAITDSTGTVTDEFSYDSYGNLTSRTGATDAIFLYNGEYGVITDNNGLLYMRARYYSPVLRRFINADILMGDINNPSSLNRYAYANGNPISNIDPFGMAADESRGGSSDLWNSLLNFGKDFVTISGNILESVWILTSGFEIQAGYGTGLRGSANILGETVSMSAGGKVDLLTLKITYNEIDLGQETLLGTSFSLANIDWLSFDINEGYYESFIDGKTTEYKCMKPETTIELVGIDIYLIIGGNASLSYDYGSVWDRLSNVWK